MNFQELLMELARQNSGKAALSIIASFVLGHLLPIAHFIGIGILLVTSDWVTGVWAAMRREEKITSKGLRRTVEKIFLYSLAILLVMVVESAFFHTHILTAAVALYISLVELFSNLENISDITGSNIISAFRKSLFTRFPALKYIFTNKKEQEPNDQETSG